MFCPLPPLVLGKKFQAGKTCLDVSLGPLDAVYPSTTSNGPNTNFPIELKAEAKGDSITAAWKGGGSL